MHCCSSQRSSVAIPLTCVGIPPTCLIAKMEEKKEEEEEEKKEKKKRVRVIARTSWKTDSGETCCAYCGSWFLRENIPPIYCTCGVELCSDGFGNPTDCARRHRCAGPILTMEVTDEEEEVEEEEEKQEEEDEAPSSKPRIKDCFAHADWPAMLAPVVPPTRPSSCQELPALPPLPSFGEFATVPVQMYRALAPRKALGRWTGWVSVCGRLV